jgi:hypothetical protein
MSKRKKCCQKESAVAKKLLQKGHSNPADAVDKIVEELES